MRAIGYVRVSTQEQEDSGAGLQAQRDAIGIECERRGFELEEYISDTCSGSTPWTARDGLKKAIGMLEAGEADVLICAKLDRLSRSVLDFANIVERARKKKWAINLLDFGLDMSTPVGEMVAAILVAVAQFERRRIGERTKDALKAKKAAGVKLGRPSRTDPLIVEFISRCREKPAHSYAKIAGFLNDDNIPTAEGRAWRDNTVRAIYLANKPT